MNCEVSNLGNSDSDCFEPYYALPLWKEYLAAMARWKEAHSDYCKTPKSGMKAQRRQELLDAESEKDRLLALLRRTPEHLKAFGW
jgi:hypothetical protein